ncbi:hypothetical protein [uncultured Duncaniella sp.]|uniref:hypothetical protein n=1 Tax=uncultured Duncaniella sp. TaxID=2768039 RepID=UPI0026174CAF|nr:hypothetical protein [uncultured Duncaniella sp.]
MTNNEKSLFWICVILTMSMAFTALMISLPRTADTVNPTRLDYQGTIVAIFALLVTALIGWQIYSALGIDRRVYKAEKRIANMLSRLQATQTKIDATAESSEYYSNGANLLLMALIDYVQTNNNAAMSNDEKIKHYRNCYIVSTKSIADLVNSNKDKKLISPLLDMCLQCISLSTAFLFKDENIQTIKDVFTEDKHEKCEMHYAAIMKNSAALGAEYVTKINEYRLKRLQLLK